MTSSSSELAFRGLAAGPYPFALETYRDSSCYSVLEVGGPWCGMGLMGASPECSQGLIEPVDSVEVSG